MARLPANAEADTRDRYQPRAGVWPKLLITAFCLWWGYAILDDNGVWPRLAAEWERIRYRLSGAANGPAPATPAPSVSTNTSDTNGASK
jgi:hypothetical protein